MGEASLLTEHTLYYIIKGVLTCLTSSDMHSIISVIRTREGGVNNKILSFFSDSPLLRVNIGPRLPNSSTNQECNVTRSLV